MFANGPPDLSKLSGDRFQFIEHGNSSEFHAAASVTAGFGGAYDPTNPAEQFGC